jgi:Kef-type K+ transport system membrane component KefB
LSSAPLLVLLLVLAYVGSILVSDRTIRGWGLPSGSEYIVLGFVLGPNALVGIDMATLSSLEPLIQIGLGWLALVVGVEYGHLHDRRVPIRRMFTGTGLALLSGFGVAAAFGAFAFYLGLFKGNDLLIAALGAGAVSCETTRHAVRWVVERYSAKGPLSELVGDIAEADDVVPLIAITVAFALAPNPGIELAFPVWALSAATLVIGLVLGGFAAALLRIEDRPTETWGIVLGAALLGIGLGARMGQSPFGLLFALGVAMATFSGKRRVLREMLVRTEHPVLLPVLVLAGAFIDIRASKDLPWIVVLVILARVGMKYLSGAILRLSATARGAGRVLGFGLLPSGALTVAFGLAFALRFPTVVGHTVLAIAAAVALFGELVGPTSLRAALKRAGEIEPRSSGEQPSTETASP